MLSACVFLTSYDAMPPEIANGDLAYLQKFETMDLTDGPERGAKT